MSTDDKIPKIIHYCWFGNIDKPNIVKKCIDSWERNLEGYEIKEWNEMNFDINCNEYVRQAYESKKYAFVSDYARVYALYNYGGIYLDTDVEVFKTFNDLLNNESIWGFEQENYIATSTIGSKKGNELIQKFLDSYKNKTFIKEDGSFDDLTNVAIITSILKEYGLKANGEYQKLEGVATFYPQTYFSPYDYINCRNFKNEDTYCMHHFYKSWLPISVRIKCKVKKVAANLIGGNNIAKIRSVVSKN